MPTRKITDAWMFEAVA